jgi:hypothetical protein
MGLWFLHHGLEDLSDGSGLYGGDFFLSCAMASGFIVLAVLADDSDEFIDVSRG